MSIQFRSVRHVAGGAEEAAGGKMSEAKWKAWRQVDKRTGRWERRWREPGSRKKHMQLESRWLYEREHGLLPDGHVVHHINGDPTNDALDNLQLLSDREHRALHALLQQDHKIIEGVEHKRCPECGDYKPSDLFYMRNDGRFGAYCKVCDRERRVLYKERKKSHNQVYYAEHREHLCAYARKYRAEHKDRVRASNQTYYTKNKDRLNARTRARRTEKRAAREAASLEEIAG